MVTVKSLGSILRADTVALHISWTATENSHVTTLDGMPFTGSTPINVDANSGAAIYYDNATRADGTFLTPTFTLSSGGTLVKK